MNVNDLMNEELESNSDNVSRETFNKDSNEKTSFFRVPSLDKGIEEYLTHPLNRKKDEDFGQGLRGVEAFLGNTNLAIIDLLGFVKYFFKNRSRKDVEDAT